MHNNKQGNQIKIEKVRTVHLATTDVIFFPSTISWITKSERLYVKEIVPPMSFTILFIILFLFLYQPSDKDM
jgi:hypothetical protein